MGSFNAMALDKYACKVDVGTNVNVFFDGSNPILGWSVSRLSSAPRPARNTSRMLYPLAIAVFTSDLFSLESSRRSCWTSERANVVPTVGSFTISSCFSAVLERRPGRIVTFETVLASGTSRTKLSMALTGDLPAAHARLGTHGAQPTPSRT